MPGPFHTHSFSIFLLFVENMTHNADTTMFFFNFNSVDVVHNLLPGNVTMNLLIPLSDLIFLQKPNHMKGDANHWDEMFIRTSLGHYKQNKQFDCLGQIASEYKVNSGVLSFSFDNERVVPQLCGSCFG